MSTAGNEERSRFHALTVLSTAAYRDRTRGFLPLVQLDGTHIHSAAS